MGGGGGRTNVSAAENHEINITGERLALVTTLLRLSVYAEPCKYTVMLVTCRQCAYLMVSCLMAERWRCTVTGYLIASCLTAERWRCTATGYLIASRLTAAACGCKDQRVRTRTGVYW